MATNIEQSYQERILKVLIYIQNNLDGDLSLDNLAQVAFFSPYHFHRIFTAHTGESIKSYVRRLRLLRASKDLIYTDKPIIRIAERAGYDTQQSFHRAFKEAYQLTPKIYRDQSRSNAEEKIKAQIDAQCENTLATHDKLQRVSLKTIEPFSVLFIRHVGSYEYLLQPWLKLLTEVGTEHIFSDSAQKIGIAYDDPDTTDKDKLRYDACVSTPQSQEIKPKGQLGTQIIQGGQYAVITHHGSLNDIDKTYKYLFGVWLPQSGFEPADHPNFMRHCNIPFQTPDADLITDIYLPLR